ncbi:MAG: sugar phosphate isomerase/epimerase [Bacteroidota bacterium]
MTTNRRDFIRISSMAAAGTILLPSCTFGKSKMKPGLQVYSVRNQLNEDFEGTMEYVAKVGYKHIEGYGLGTDGKFLGKISAKNYTKVITDLGMELKASHCSYTTADKAQKMIDAAKETGMEYMIVPHTPDEVRQTADGWKKVAENYNKIGEMCNKVGLKFGYHNHDFEFKPLDGIIPQELLIESTDAGLVHFEADLFWVTKGGYDPLKLIKKYPGRIKLFHVKDATADLEGTTVGQGIIDFETIFKAGRADAVEYYFVEDEREDDPFKNIEADYKYISSQGFAS